MCLRFTMRINLVIHRTSVVVTDKDIDKLNMYNNTYILKYTPKTITNHIELFDILC